MMFGLVDWHVVAVAQTLRLGRGLFYACVLAAVGTDVTEQSILTPRSTAIQPSFANGSIVMCIRRDTTAQLTLFISLAGASPSSHSLLWSIGSLSSLRVS